MTLRKEVQRPRLRSVFWFSGNIVAGVSAFMFSFYFGVKVPLVIAPKLTAPTSGYLNYYGYNGGTTQFRDLTITDGHGTTNRIAKFRGTSTLGDCCSDSHTINGTIRPSR